MKIFLTGMAIVAGFVAFGLAVAVFALMRM